MMYVGAICMLWCLGWFVLALEFGKGAQRATAASVMGTLFLLSCYATGYFSAF